MRNEKKEPSENVSVEFCQGMVWNDGNDGRSTHNKNKQQTQAHTHIRRESSKDGWANRDETGTCFSRQANKWQSSNEWKAAAGQTLKQDHMD